MNKKLPIIYFDKDLFAVWDELPVKSRNCKPETNWIPWILNQIDQEK